MRAAATSGMRVASRVSGSSTKALAASMGMRTPAQVAGEIPRIPLNLPLLMERTILGVFCGEWTERNRRAADEMYEEIAGWVASGRLSPAITSRLTLDEIPGGLEDLTRRRVVGKLVATL